MTAFDIFFSYSHRDEELRDQLERHLAPLKRAGLIGAWHDRKIRPGDDWAGVIDGKLETSDLVLLLVSSDFLASDYCYELEMTRALERHEEGSARVIPVLLRPCAWQTSPFAKLQGLPKDFRPVVSWANRDEAWVDVVHGLRQVVGAWTRGEGEEPLGSLVDANEIIEAIDSAYEQRVALIATGSDTTEIDARILELKRRHRADGQLKEGAILGDRRWKLQKLIGQGGFAEVWLAFDTKLRRQVAVKVLHGQYSRDKSRRDRFFRGARQMSQLGDLPGIVDVIEPECQDGALYFFVMEYIGGGDFRKAVLDDQLDREARLRVIFEVGKTLQAAHERGIVHRDVKPANVLLTLDGEAKLTDFDLVRALDTSGGTRTGKLGTFLYAAPEALSNASQAGAAADVFGLGMTAVFAIYGRDLPFEALISQTSFLDQLEIEPHRKSALARAVAHVADERWATCKEFCRSFEIDVEVAEMAAVITEPSEDSSLRDPSAEDDEAGALLVEPVIGMRFRFIPAGSFLMGSPEDEPGRYADETQHRVHLSRGYWLSETPVTQAQWFQVMGTNPSHFKYAGPDAPVESVNWFEAVAFANEMSVRAGHVPGYKVFDANDQRAGEGLEYRSVVWGPHRSGFRLPTEAEWEHAARAGTTTAIYTGDMTFQGERNCPELDEIAFYGGNSGVTYDGGKDSSKWAEKQVPGSSTSGTHPVGQKKPNPWGLLDMLGNIWEWCEEAWAGDDYLERTAVNPLTTEGPGRIVRGGSWNVYARNGRAACRNSFVPEYCGGIIGFRLLLGQARFRKPPGGEPAGEIQG